MASAEPPYLAIGTDVSAKYRGAFCEAKVKKIIKSVKCKVYMKDTLTSLQVTDDCITGPLKVGAVVEVKHPDTGRQMEGTIAKMTDSSMYTVVFDDADERTLRRTMLCLKGDKHFIESETLDNLPLSNPEQFGTPVIKQKRRSTGPQDESEASSEEEESPKRRLYKGRNQDLVGKIMFLDSGDKKRPQQIPVLVTLPDAHNTELKNKDHLLVRSFKDGKYQSASRKELVMFTRDVVLKNEDKSLRPAMEKALLYVDNKEVPPSWNYRELLGSDDEPEDDGDESTDDDEPTEEKDRFVAQLYKFCDDRGTPMNKPPSIGSKDLNLYKLFKTVQNIGGYNRVTNQMKWRLVYSKMGLPPSNNASNQIRNAYKKYLHAFEDFYRKLGSSMGTISRPGRQRHDSGRGILNFRGRDKEIARENEAKAELARLKDSPAAKLKDSPAAKLKDSPAAKLKDSPAAKEKESDVSKEKETSVAKEKDTVAKVKAVTISKPKSPGTPVKEKEPITSKKEPTTARETVTAPKEKETTVARAKAAAVAREKEATATRERVAAFVKEKVALVAKEKVVPVADVKVAFPKETTSAKVIVKPVKFEENRSPVVTETEQNKGTPKRPKSARQKPEMKEMKEDTSKEQKDDAKEVKKDEPKEKREIKKVDPMGWMKKSAARRMAERQGGKAGLKVEGKAVPKVEGKAEPKVEGKVGPKVEGKVEGVKPGPKKKEEAAAQALNDAEEELEDLQKKIGRRRSTRKEEEEDEPEPTNDRKPEDMEAEKDDKKAKKPGPVKKAKTDMEGKSDDDASKPTSSAPTVSEPAGMSKLKSGLAVGSKLRVRYGKGKYEKVYEAKILETGFDSGHRQYYVHYAGWNNRHDEWIRIERIVKVIDRPEKRKLPRFPINPFAKVFKKTVVPDKPPSSPSSSKSSSSDTAMSSAPVKTPPKSKSPVPSKDIASGKQRPTRSNSLDIKVIEGLLTRRRKRSTSGMQESTKGSDSEDTEQSEVEVEVEVTPESDDTKESIKPSTSMPAIDANKSVDAEMMELNSSIELSPPLLSKVVDITPVKEKMEVEEKVEDKAEKPEIKDDVAPILKVEKEKLSEPILQKLEAQLCSSIPVAKVETQPIVEVKEPAEIKPIEDTSQTVETKPVTDTKQISDAKPSEDNEKVEVHVVKKKEPEKRGRKPHMKVVEESPKKAEKIEVKVDDVKTTPVKDSLYDFKDEPEYEAEFKGRERRKPIVVLEEINKDSTSDIAKSLSPKLEDSAVLLKKLESVQAVVAEGLSLFENIDNSQSDSEPEVKKVERRGRKKKMKVEEEPKEIRKPQMTLAEKKLVQINVTTEKKTSPEKKIFVTLAGKKQVYSPLLKKSPIVSVDKSAACEPSKPIVVDESARVDIVKEKPDVVEDSKVADLIVVHKASPVKNVDSVTVRKPEVEAVVKLFPETETKKEDISEAKNKIVLDLDEPEPEGFENERKKVGRKKTKKKFADESDTEVLPAKRKVRVTAKVREGLKRGRDWSNRVDNVVLSGVREPVADIDLRCEERIRSRSASPVHEVKTSTYLSHESQGFEPLFEAMECRLRDSQQMNSNSINLRDDRPHSSRHNLYENTPPSTPENESDSQGEQMKHGSSGKHGDPVTLDISQPAGSESPGGNASPSSNRSSGSSGIVAGSEGSIDVPVPTTKRRRESDESTPTKRRKRISRGKAHRVKHESDTDEASNVSSKCRSPLYTSDSYPRVTSLVNRMVNRSPRPAKYNFNLEDGKYLEGGARITFLVDKITEIRKIYMNLKSEVACIDRRRKRMRRKEKDKDSASSSTVEVEAS